MEQDYRYETLFTEETGSYRVTCYARRMHAAARQEKRQRQRGALEALMQESFKTSPDCKNAQYMENSSTYH